MFFGRDTLRDGIEGSQDGELMADLNLEKHCVIHNIAP